MPTRTNDDSSYAKGSQGSQGVKAEDANFDDEVNRNASITVALLQSQSAGTGSAGKASFADCDNDNDNDNDRADNGGGDDNGNVHDDDDQFDDNDDRWIKAAANDMQPETIHPLPQSTPNDGDESKETTTATTSTTMAMASPPTPNSVTKIKTDGGNANHDDDDNDEDDNDDGTAEESKKERTVTDIIDIATTTLEPSGSTTATAATPATTTKPPRKKRKKNTGGSVGGSCYVSSSSASSSSSSPFRNMDDSEFVRVIAVEFKRRGYVVAIQLRPLEERRPPPRQPSIDEEDDATATTTTNNNKKDAERQKGTTNKKKTKKKKMSSSHTNNRNHNAVPLASNLPNFPFHPSTTSISAKNAKSWNAAFDRVKSYREEHCGALPTQLLHHSLHNSNNNNNNDDNNDNNDNGDPSSSNQQQQQQPNPALIKWTKTQLNLWKRIKKDGKHNLSLERICKLHSLDFERHSERGGDHVVCCGRSGNASLLLLGNTGSAVDGRESEGKVGIGGVGVGIGNEEGGEGMDEKALENQMMLMASMGKNKQKWQEKFDKLRRYKEEYGHTNVPRSYDDGLSKWCATQRLRCKEFMKGNVKTPMTRMQFQALESVGFNMNRKRKLYDRSVLDRKWEEKFNELLRYKEKFGNTDVAVRKGFEEYKQLANWAGLMRRKFKAKQTGTKAGRTTGITDDEIKKLASVGFSFSLQDDFDTRFKHLLEFKKEFGHTKVPVFYTGYNNLGRWAKRMRDGIRLDEPWVDDVRKARLLGIDFDIAARHVFGHKPKKKSEEEEQRAVEVEEAMEEVMVEDDAVVVDEDEDGMRMAQVLDQPVEAPEVAAAATMARMDNTDFGRPSLPPFGNAVGPHFFSYEKYHGYQHTQP